MALMVTVSPEKFGAVLEVLKEHSSSLITGTLDGGEGKKIILCPNLGPMVMLAAMQAGAATTGVV